MISISKKRSDKFAFKIFERRMGFFYFWQKKRKTAPQGVTYSLIRFQYELGSSLVC